MVGGSVAGAWRQRSTNTARTAEGRSAGRRFRAPAAPKVARGAGPGGRGVGESLTRGPWVRGAPSPRGAPPRPYLGPPAARGRRAAAAAAGPGATGRRAPWAAGGERRADKGAERGAQLSAPGAARGQRGLQAPAEPPQPTQGPGRAVQLSRPGGGRGGGGAAGRPLPSPLDRSPPGTSGALPPGTPGPRGAQAHGRAGNRDPRLPPCWGPGKGGAVGREAPPPHPSAPLRQ